MEDKRGPAAGQLFFNKDMKLLQFILLAVDKDSQKEIAVYQDLTGDYKVYAKELSSFLMEMTPYSVELPEAEQKIVSEYTQPAAKFHTEPTARSNEVKEMEEIKTRQEDNEAVSPVLLAFLDADTYEEKLNVLVGSRKNLTDRIVNHMAISMDCIIEDGDIEDRINNLIYCLKTHARFEDKRLR
jgi:hypothetical protein